MKNTLYSIILIASLSLFVGIANATSAPSVKTGSEQNISWNTVNFSVGSKVSINLIRKVSDSPAKYEFVRKLSTDIANDGSEAWTPLRTEIGNDFMIEVVCSNTPDSTNGCSSTNNNQTFAIKGSFGANLANVFDAFIQFIESLFK